MFSPLIPVWISEAFTQLCSHINVAFRFDFCLKNVPSLIMKLLTQGIKLTLKGAVGKFSCFAKGVKVGLVIMA